MFKIYYFENYGTKDVVSADGLDFTKNINDALNYIVNIKKENFNFSVSEKSNIYGTRIEEILGKENTKKFVETDKKITFKNGVTMYRILKNDTLKDTVDIVFFYLSTPYAIKKICEIYPNKIFIWAPYLLDEIDELKKNKKFELIELKIKSKK